jgi:hypothetical protein
MADAPRDTGLPSGLGAELGPQPQAQLTVQSTQNLPAGPSVPNLSFASQAEQLQPNEAQVRKRSSSDVFRARAAPVQPHLVDPGELQPPTTSQESAFMELYDQILHGLDLPTKPISMSKYGRKLYMNALKSIYTARPKLSFAIRHIHFATGNVEYTRENIKANWLLFCVATGREWAPADDITVPFVEFKWALKRCLYITRYYNEFGDFKPTGTIPSPSSLEQYEQLELWTRNQAMRDPGVLDPGLPARLESLADGAEEAYMRIIALPPPMLTSQWEQNNPATQALQQVRRSFSLATQTWGDIQHRPGLEKQMYDAEEHHFFRVQEAYNQAHAAYQFSNGDSST